MIAATVADLRWQNGAVTGGMRLRRRLDPEGG
jgi:hypothetical protein